MKNEGKRNTKNKTKTLQPSSSIRVTEYASTNISLAEAATSIIFIVKHVFHSDKSMLAAKTVLSQQNSFAVTKLLLQQIFVVTKTCLTWQKFCHDKHIFVVTKDMFSHNKHMSVTTKTFHNKNMFVMTSILLSRQK